MSSQSRSRELKRNSYKRNRNSLSFTNLSRFSNRRFNSYSNRLSKFLSSNSTKDTTHKGVNKLSHRHIKSVIEKLFYQIIIKYYPYLIFKTQLDNKKLLKIIFKDILYGLTGQLLTDYIFMSAFDKLFGKHTVYDKMSRLQTYILRVITPLWLMLGLALPDHFKFMQKGMIASKTNSEQTVNNAPPLKPSVYKRISNGLSNGLSRITRRFSKRNN